MFPIRLCIVDGHVLVRAGLKMLLDVNSQFKVVGEATNREEALKIGSKQRPHMFLVDVGEGPDAAPEFLKDLLSSSPGAQAILVTASTDSDLLHRSIDAGANGLVLKADPPEMLIRAIERVHAGEIWLSRKLVTSVLTGRSRDQRRDEDPEQIKISSLTRREREVAILVASGFDRNQAAKRLSLSPSAVRNHLTAVFAKLGVSSQYELVFYAQRNGLVEEPSFLRNRPATGSLPS